MHTRYFLNDSVINKLSSIIEAYNGGEIFFGCILDENGNIINVDPICYGNDNTVLAPYEIVNKYNAILHNHPSDNVKPSEQDLYYAEYLQQEGIGFFITNNKATSLTTVVPPVISKKNKKLDLEFVKSLFTDDDKIIKYIADYEFREGQQNMSFTVSKAFNNNNIAIIEAGTGIGKTLAYLIPAFYWADINKERVVISTNTINLQNQLLNKDIPIVKKILNSKIQAVLVKGRRNYLCKLKIYNIQNELEFDENIEEFNSLLEWSKSTENGDIDELNFIPTFSVWERFSSDFDFCTGRNCNYFQNCFFQKARRKASESNILIVNHHILFADIDIKSQGRGIEENTFLPPYKKIIFDEAHNIIKSASSYFSYSFSKSGFYKFLGYLKKKKEKGFLPRFYKKLLNSNSVELYEIAELIKNNILEKFDLLLKSSHEIFNLLDVYLYNIIKNYDYTFINKLNIQYRIKKDEWNDENFKLNFIKNLINLNDKIEELEKSFEEVTINFEKTKNEVKNEYEIDLKIFKSYRNKIVSLYQNLSNLVQIDIDEYIPWLDINGDENNPNFRFIATPLYLEKILAQNLFEIYNTIILSSATLTVNKSLEYFKGISGLSLVREKEIISEVIESPFNYKENVMFIVPDDIPVPNHNNYNDNINNFLKELIITLNGSTFVLFTSYIQLKKSFEDVNNYLKGNGLKCYYQGEMEKSKLLDKFIIDINSSLFATNSFWEGVDAPGKTLRCVILAKLPFNIPTDPIEEAKIEDMEKRGINSFINYTLPQAIIKFRQGIGRLIRKKDDYGVIGILDSRILKKSYGKFFINSLPECEFVYSNSENILNYVRSHLKKFEMRHIK